ncbi:MAG TPA: hypothetical protein VFK47_06780, partial [Ktedonobacteraceae bacterium]|nr:hypothetical protein [Ktedonobacteraceae bacterium]
IEVEVQHCRLDNNVICFLYYIFIARHRFEQGGYFTYGISSTQGITTLPGMPAGGSSNATTSGL